MNYEFEQEEIQKKLIDKIDFYFVVFIQANKQTTNKQKEMKLKYEIVKGVTPCPQTTI